MLAHGVSNAEACRLAGINRRTGTRWRYGRQVRNSAGVVVHYPPVKIKELGPRSPRYLSERERISIADLLSVGVTVRGIAAELGRAPSTVSREIRRNSDLDGRYRPHHAERAARLRASKPRQAANCARGGDNRGRRRVAGEALESGAGRARTPQAVRRSAVAVAVQGVDLPGDLWRFCCFRGWGEGLGARVARSVVVCQAATGCNGVREVVVVVCGGFALLDSRRPPR